MTGDEHGCCGGTRERWNSFLAADPAGCSVDDWQCVRGTSYVYPGPGMSDAEGASFAAQGFELATHVNTGCGNWTPATLEGFFATQLGDFAAQFPSVPAPATNLTEPSLFTSAPSATRTTPPTHPSPNQRTLHLETSGALAPADGSRYGPGGES